MTLALHNIVLPLAGFGLEVNATLTAPITGLTGPSGAGKTSLLEIIAGLRRPTTGCVQFNTITLTDVANRIFVRPWDRKVGYVPQDQALFPHLSVEQNLLFACRAGRAPLNESLRAKVLAVLELQPLLRRGIGNLSGGEKCRVALGRTLMSRPALLLLDEPLAHLDDRLRLQTLDYLQATASEFHIPLVFVSHSAVELNRICGDIRYMEQGRLQPEAINENPE